MAYDNGQYGSPEYPVWDGNGKPALQAMSEALVRREAREEQMEDSPSMATSMRDWDQEMNDYSAICHGQDLMGASTFEPGDAFVPKKG